MKRDKDHEEAASSSHNLSTLDQATLAKKARESNVSYRTVQRWAHRGAFAVDNLLEDVFAPDDSPSISTVALGQSTAPGHSECADSYIDPSSDDSSEDSDSSSESEENNSSDDGLEGDKVKVDFDFEVEEETVSFDINDKGFTRLHSATDKTVEEVVFSFMRSYLKHNKSRSCLEDDLNVLNSALPVPNQMPKSIYYLMQFVEGYAPPCPITEYFCCENCQFFFGSSRVEACTACGSKKSITFYIMSVEQQIKYLFEHRGLACELRKASETRNFDESVITDITDGSEYQRVNVNRKPYDLTLILSTDGAKLKRSSTADLWPVSFTISEVRSSVRHLFITCVGVWYSKKKPELNTLLRPVAVELRALSKAGGVKWLDPESGEECTSNISAPVIVGDAPVRAEALKHQHHNGKRGCITCEIKTQRTTRTEGERRKRVYKYCEECQLRTKARMLVFAKEAESRGIVVRGVKGRTVVSLLPGVDESTVVFGEFMHSVCLGLAKQVLLCWTGNRSADLACNLKDFVPELNRIVTALKPPSFFSRSPPRSVTDYPQWKAYEYLYWTLFYSVLVFVELREEFPTEDKIIKFEPYFDHWLLFVHSMSILMQAKVKLADLAIAEILLKSFVREFECLYGEKELSYNLHQMLHLCLNCKRWGPMPDISAFPFENFIGLIGKSVNGNRHVGKEIMKKVKISQGVQALGNAIEWRNLAFTERKSNQCLGKIVENTRVDRFVLAFLIEKDLSPGNVSVYARARINRRVFTSKLCSEIATVDYCVRVKCVESLSVLIGAIELFVQCQGGIYIVVNKFPVNHQNLLVCNAENQEYVVESFIPVKTNERNLVAVDVKSIDSIENVFMHKDFVCVIPKALRIKSVVM